MSRVYNFSAGPAVLPEEVSERRRRRRCWTIQGHRDVRDGDEPPFQSVRGDYHNDAEQDLRDLMNIPDNYRVLVPSGRGVPAVRDDPHEPDEEPAWRTIS